MKSYKYVFKFVNNFEKKILMIDVEVKHNSHIKWIHEHSDVEGYLNWLVSNVKFEHSLTMNIHKIVKDAYFGGSADFSTDIGTYKIAKESRRTEGDMANLQNEADSKQMIYTKVFWRDLRMYKLTLGKPEYKMITHTYPKEYHAHVFNLVSEIGSTNIKLDQVCHYTVPFVPNDRIENEPVREAVEQIEIDIDSIMNQSGGDDNNTCGLH